MECNFLSVGFIDSLKLNMTVDNQHMITEYELFNVVNTSPLLIQLKERFRLWLTYLIVYLSKYIFD